MYDFINISFNLNYIRTIDPRGVDQVAIECTVKSLLATSQVQALSSPCPMDGGCVGASRRIVVVYENKPLVMGVQSPP